MKTSKKLKALLGESEVKNVEQKIKPVHHQVATMRDEKGQYQVVDESKCQAEVYYWPWANGGAGHIAIHVHPPGHNGTYLTPGLSGSPVNNARLEGLLKKRERLDPATGERIITEEQQYEDKDIFELLTQDNRSLGISSRDVRKDVIRIPLPVVDRAYFSLDEQESFVFQSKPHGEYELLCNNCAHLTRAALHWSGYAAAPVERDFALLPSTVAEESCAIALRMIKGEKNKILKQEFSSDVEKIKALLVQDIEALKINEIQEAISWRKKKTAAKVREKIEDILTENDPIEFYKKLFIVAQSSGAELNTTLNYYLNNFVPEHQREFAIILVKIDEMHVEAQKIERNGFADDAKAIRDMAESLQSRAEHYFSVPAEERKKGLAEFKEFGNEKIKEAAGIASRHKGIQKILTYLSKMFSKLGALAPSLPFFKRSRRATEVSPTYEVKIKRAW